MICIANQLTGFYIRATLAFDGLITRHFSKKHPSFLGYHMKLSQCHINVTATAIRLDLGPYLTSKLSEFKRTHKLLFPLKSSENRWFSDDFTKNRS